MGTRYYLYTSQEEDEKSRKQIGEVYILQKEIGKNPPSKMKLMLEWA